MSQFNNKKNQRCRWFDINGQPKDGGCRRSTCWFSHPHEPEWSNGRAWNDDLDHRDGKGFNRGPSTRGGFNEAPRTADSGYGNRAKRDVSSSASRPAESGGWGNMDASASIGTKGQSSGDNKKSADVDAWGAPIAASSSASWGWGAEPAPEASGWGVSAWGDPTPAKDPEGGGWPAASGSASGADAAPATSGGGGGWGDSASTVKDSNAPAATGSGWGEPASPIKDSGTLGWGKPASPIKDSTTPVTTGSAWDNAASTGWNTEQTSTGWNAGGTSSAWGETADKGKGRAMDTGSGADAWGSHHDAAPSQTPDITQSSSFAVQDPDRQDASSSATTRVSRSGRGKQSSDRDDTMHADVPPYEIPPIELQSIHILFVAAIDAQEELEAAEAKYKHVEKISRAQIYKFISPQAMKIRDGKVREARLELDHARAKNNAYLDALERYQDAPEPEPANDDADDQAALDYLLNSVMPWLADQDKRIKDAHAHLDKLFAEAGSDTAGESSTASKRQRVFSPEMEAKIHERRAQLDTDDRELADLTAYLDGTVAPNLDSLVAAEIEKLLPEEGQVVEHTLGDAERRHEDLAQEAEAKVQEFDDRKDGLAARQAALLEVQANLVKSLSGLESQRAQTEAAWNDLEDQLNDLDEALQRYTADSNRTAAVVAAGEQRINEHFEEYVEPAFAALRTQFVDRFEAQFKLIQEAVDQHIVPAEDWLTRSNTSS